MEANEKTWRNLYLEVTIIRGVELDKQSKINEQTSVCVVVNCNGDIKKTQKISGSANPSWLETLSFNLKGTRLKIGLFPPSLAVTTVHKRKLAISVFWIRGDKSKRIGKIKHEFELDKLEKKMYIQKLTRGKLIYSLEIAQHPAKAPLSLTTAPKPQIMHLDQWSSSDEEIDQLPSESSDDEGIDESSSEDEQINRVPEAPKPTRDYQIVQRLAAALEPATPKDIMDYVVKAMVPKTVVTGPDGCAGAIGKAIGTAIADACGYMICYAILLVCIIFAVTFVLVTRFM